MTIKKTEFNSPTLGKTVMYHITGTPEERKQDLTKLERDVSSFELQTIKEKLSFNVNNYRNHDCLSFTKEPSPYYGSYHNPLDQARKIHLEQQHAGAHLLGLIPGGKPII